MKFFQKLGARVDELWRVQGYDEAIFSAVALQALQELPPDQHTCLLDVVCGATQASNLPTQVDMKATFGDPPLTVFEGRSFRIEVLFWLRGVPGIHQHAFSGAFHVLEGSSIHTRWRFVPEERVNLRLILGRAEFTEVEILRRGDNREIIAGPGMLHATYHMDKPSLTVVVRTIVEHDKAPQYSIMPPHVAHVPSLRHDIVVRQSQLLQMMLQTHPEECLRHLRCLMSLKDTYWVFEVLDALWSSIDDEEARQQLLATARHHHPALLQALEPSFDQVVRGDHITRVRGDVGDDSELRFLLALLRNVPDGDEIRRLIALCYPDTEVVDLIERWVRRVVGSGTLGFSFHESWFLALRYLLRGLSAEQIAERFASSESVPGGPRDLAEVEELCRALKTSWLLYPLFVRSRVQVS